MRGRGQGAQYASPLRSASGKQARSRMIETDSSTDRMVHRAMRVFLSHSHADTELARRLANDLRRRGIEAWLSADSVAPGELWDEAVAAAIDSADAVVILFSERSARSSWADAEIAYALGKERPKKALVIPVLLGGVSTAMLPPLLSRIQCVRASEKEYELALEEVVSALHRRASPLRDVATAPTAPVGNIRLTPGNFDHAHSGRLVRMEARREGVAVTAFVAASIIALGGSIALLLTSAGSLDGDLGDLLLGSLPVVTCALGVAAGYYFGSLRRGNES